MLHEASKPRLLLPSSANIKSITGKGIKFFIFQSYNSARAKGAEYSPQSLPQPDQTVVAKLNIKPLGCYIVYIFSLLTAEGRDIL